jgi:fimbrial chaperone protein
VFAVVMLVLCATAAQAVTISPVVVELSPSRQIATITFTNPGEQSLRYQTQAMVWSQADGVDHREITNDLIVVPPIAEIPPGARQIFRVTLRTNATGQEQAYRLIFEDITKTSASADQEVAIHLLVNHDLPVFVAAAGNPQPQLQLGPCLDKPAGIMNCVRVNNIGDRYAQIRGFTLERGDWQHELPVSARVLAGAWRQWEFELPAESNGPLRVTVQSSKGETSVELPVDTR